MSYPGIAIRGRSSASFSSLNIFQVTGGPVLVISAISFDLSLPQIGLITIKYDGNLLQGISLGFGKVEINRRQYTNKKDTVYNIVLPSQIVDPDRVSE